ncbi:PilZ domain-containing protein [candidate division KSB1 bacterium]|nr:PilZ domain-containing protein [candidate division KSB1 bacterium]
MQPTTTTERRKSKRKNVKSGLVALLHPDRPIKVGRILDINCNGISFIVDNDQGNSDSKDPVSMDIFLINENIFLQHITTSVISNTIWQDDPQLNKYNTARRYGVKFEELETTQERQLRKLTAETSS